MRQLQLMVEESCSAIMSQLVDRAIEDVLGRLRIEST